LKLFWFLAIAFYSLNAVATELMPGDPKLTKLAWYAEKIDLFRAWKIVDGAPDVLVAVHDLDFDVTHADLVDSFDLKIGRDFSGANFKNYSPDAKSAQHGTLVSAIIGASGTNKLGTSGILKRSHIIPLNWGGINTEEIRYAVDHGARVINCSWSYFSVDAKTDKAIREAIQYAADKGVLMVFAAGNFPDQSDAMYPASPLTTEFDNVISVGASDEQDRKAMSNFGKKTVDLFAPGKNIIVPINHTKYDLSEGTSEAAPIVSGIAALMFQLNPKLHAREVKSILMKTVDKVPALKTLCRSAGRVNAGRAVELTKKLSQRKIEQRRN
jgi:subtilisin family serine protease